MTDARKALAEEIEHWIRVTANDTIAEVGAKQLLSRAVSFLRSPLPVTREEVARANIEGIVADCISIEPLRWKDEDGKPAILAKITGIHEAANQIRAALAPHDKTEG